LGSGWNILWAENKPDISAFHCALLAFPFPRGLIITHIFGSSLFFGVSAAQVYLAKHRISGLLKKEIKKLERGR
jgi:hypothetical protein